jgi:hypothetical protein
MIMNGMERFKHVIMDFTDVRLIGQGFADEVLRVWQKEHLSTEVTWTNTNPDVEFMLRQALKTDVT